jgi:aspartate-semialdehyde dehydrogenase
VGELPSAPAQPVVYFDTSDAPQPQRQRMLGQGMTVSVGRLKSCPVLDFRFVLLVHNTIRGAAGGAILNAELLYRRGYLDD